MWAAEIAKAVLIAIAVWGSTAIAKSPGETDHRLTVLETRETTRTEDLKVIKDDIKQIKEFIYKYKRG